MCFKINTLRRLIYSICEDILKDKEGKKWTKKLVLKYV